MPDQLHSKLVERVIVLPFDPLHQQWVKADALEVIISTIPTLEAVEHVLGAHQVRTATAETLREAGQRTSDLSSHLRLFALGLEHFLQQHLNLLLLGLSKGTFDFSG